MLLQVLVNGLLQGGFYACIGVTFSIVFGIMRIVNLAQGTFIILGAYFTYAAVSALGVDPLVTLPAAAFGAFAIGWLIQRYVINQVAKGGLVVTSLLTFGLNLMLVNIALLIWQGDFRATNPSYMTKSFEVAGAAISVVRLATFAIALLLTGGLELFFRKTETGNAIRATALNPRAAQLMGIDIARIYAMTFAISSGLAGAMGTLYILNRPVSPFTGGDLLVVLFSVAVLGGMGSIPGAMLAGLLLGVAESLSTMVFGVAYQRVTLNLVTLLVLMLLPNGLMGKRHYA